MPLLSASAKDADARPFGLCAFRNQRFHRLPRNADLKILVVSTGFFIGTRLLRLLDGSCLGRLRFALHDYSMPREPAFTLLFF